MSLESRRPGGAPVSAHRAVRCAATLLAAGMLLSVAGCSSSDQSSTRAAYDVPGAARGELRSGGTLRWAVEEAPQTFNAFQADADEATDRVAGAVLPSLFTVDERGRPQRNPDFLDSAELTERSPQTVVYRLNPKARWSDGRRIDVTDFRAQWRALNGSSNAFWTARNAGYDRIKSITSGGKRGEIKVVFKKQYADWQGLFSPLYPKSVMGSPDAFNDTSRTRLPVVAGPFALQRTKGKARSKHGVTLVRNPDWWGRRAKLDKLVFTVVPRDERVQALQSGSVDLAEVDRDYALKYVQARKAARHGAELARKLDEGARGGSKNGGGDPQTRTHAAGAATDAKPGGDRKGDHKSDRGSDHKGDRKRDQKGDHKSDHKGDRKNPAAALPAGFTLHKALEPAYTQLALNGSHGPLADETVRHAVARAIDRKAIARSVLGPLGLPSEPLGSHLLMRVQQGYQDHSGALGSQDVQEAQAMLADAGYKGGPVKAKSDAKTDSKNVLLPEDLPISAGRGAKLEQTALREQAKVWRLADEHGRSSDEVRQARKAARERTAALTDPAGIAAAPRERAFTKNGKPLTLRFVVPQDPGSSQLRAVAGRVVRMLDRIGVRTKVIKAKSKSYFQDYVASGAYDLALYSWPGTAFPATDARPVYSKPEPSADGSLVVEQNYTRVGTDQINQLFDQASRELDPDAARELLQKADARIWAAAGSVPLYQRPQLVASRQNLMNAGAFGFETPRYQDIGYRR